MREHERHGKWEDFNFRGKEDEAKMAVKKKKVTKKKSVKKPVKRTKQVKVVTEPIVTPVESYPGDAGDEHEDFDTGE